jgi:hypothetical protein
MKEMLAIFLTESCKSWSDQHKLDRIEKITFPRAISPNDDIVFGAGGGKQIKEEEQTEGPKWDNFFVILISKASEARDYELLDVHHLKTEPLVQTTHRRTGRHRFEILMAKLRKRVLIEGGTNFLVFDSLSS